MIADLRESRAGWVWAAVAALGFVVLQLFLAPSERLWPDSARYAEGAYRVLGNDPHDAHLLAVRLWCTDQVTAAQAAKDGYAQCVAQNADHFTPTAQVRYQAIFDSRPGYPPAVAAVAPVIGVRSGLWVVPVFCGLLVLCGLSMASVVAVLLLS
ncbi:hypothetical protein [Labedaea rhizosphaerae]|uniref:Uncharacterized protein n=1 Tax=Labedaea rhizosphaerae TaxID=598644 RepID=A0A4R6S592_LABRH|nr:hypothetical protein [Labedaea rhizosphaerae]TDP94959.1 hypothetical protein EV186_105191 [Labedaea rhizosphaerae]